MFAGEGGKDWGSEPRGQPKADRWRQKEEKFREDADVCEFGVSF